MKQVKELLDEALTEKLEQMILSIPNRPEEGSKVKIRPVLIKQVLMFQETRYQNNKVYHTNYNAEEMREHALTYMQDNYRQLEALTKEFSATVLISKKGKVTVKKKGRSVKTDTTDFSHNRTKFYILQEGVPVDFLIGLGVQTKDGKIVKARYDKFRQINRYLEFIEDVVKQLPNDRTLRIIDFGCGKSYLTFAMYYYLHVLKNYDINVTGLDLKEDVIAYCNDRAAEYHYDNLHFEKGDISTYEGEEAVDMVVTLHACDTATDYAIEKAIRWGAKVIMVVPCCQHEVNRQIDCPELSQILKYGLIKERMSALITDAVRANLLEESGYETQVLEFIDMEHTPKNILIRAVKKNGLCKRKEPVSKTTDFLNIKTTLQKLLDA